MARPRKQIDPEQVKKLAAIQCSHAEMASVIGCNVRTLERRFAVAIKEGREHGTCSLKRKQYEVAMSGNVGMLIWLGKQYLGQTDRQIVENTTQITLEDKRKQIDAMKAEIIELLPRSKVDAG